MKALKHDVCDYIIHNEKYFKGIVGEANMITIALLQTADFFVLVQIL